jgi:hypothetical protein
MDRVRFLTHKGKQVLLLDYRDLADEAEMLAMIEERKRVVSMQPKASLLTVADLTGARFNRTEITRIKEANVYDLPYVRRAALVGVDSSQEAQVEAVEIFSQHHHERFDQLEAALDWIVEEGEAGTAGTR